MFRLQVERRKYLQLSGNVLQTEAVGAVVLDLKLVSFFGHLGALAVQVNAPLERKNLVFMTIH